jgi:hypothetical protein
MSANFDEREVSSMTFKRVRKCAPVLEAIRAYATVDVHSVQGWLGGGPRAAIWALLDSQVLDGVAGDIMEIGVFHGRTFALLAASRRLDERAVAVDPFGSEQRRSAFLANMERLGVDDGRMDVWDMSSEEFSKIPERAALDNRIRFLSLDGGHSQETVTVDLKIAEAVLNADGVVAFDDFFNPWYPEVTAALFDYLNGPTALVPFALAVNFGPPSRGASKIFLCHEPVVGRYRAALRGTLRRNLRKERRWQGFAIDVFDFEKGVYKFDPLLMIDLAKE